MITSALAFYELLSKVANTGKDRDRFLAVSAAALGLEGDDAEVKALFHIHDLLRRIKEDIDSLPFDEDLKQLARSNVTPFSPLADLSGVSININDSRSTLLHHNALTGLRNLHMTLSGKVRSSAPQKEFLEMSAEFRDYAIEIHTYAIPLNVRIAIHKRCEQIASMLANYAFYGGEQVKDELEALGGAIIFNVDSADEKGKSLMKRIAGSLVQSRKALATADADLGIVVGIAKKGGEFWDLLT